MSHLLKPLTLDSRLALRAKEAADALGISERKFRQIAARLPCVWIDSMRLYPVEGLRTWLAEESASQGALSAAEAGKIFGQLKDGN